MATTTVQIGDDGVIALPQDLRDKHHMHAGDVFTVTDLGEEVLLLTRGQSELARFGDRIATTLVEQGVGFDEMLEVLEEERREYYREHYAPTEPVSGQ